MCPNNPIGGVDLFMVTHHGLAQSNADPLILGLRPRVALMQNGTRKGGAIPVFETLRKSPGFEDVWQLHWSYNAGVEHNAPGVFIANVDDAATIAGVLTTPAGGGRGGPGGPPQNAGVPPAAVPGSPPAAVPPTPPAQVPPAPNATAAPGQPALGQPPAGSAPPGAPPAGPGGPGAGRGGGRGGGGAAAHTPAYYIKVSAQADGTFTVTNTRNGFSKTYVKRAS
jgi:hypothetical protein